jgi:xylulokinase
MMDTLLSLDVGTTAAKCVLFDLAGSELATTESAFQLATPQPDWVEQDPEHIWSAVITALSEIGANQAQDCNILAIGLATQGGSTLPTSEDGTPTYPVITWMDRRAAALVDQWKSNGTAQAIRNRSGWTPEAGLPLPVIAWFREHQPDVFARSKRWLSINDFLTRRLSGKFAMNPSMAGEMLLTDIQRTSWDDELCELAGITPNQLSPIYPSDAVIGGLTPQIAGLTGIKTGTPIIAGGQDHSCEALAVGMTGAGQSLLACGTAWVINGVSPTADMKSIPESMNLNYHVIPQSWTISQFLGGLGASSEWWVTHGWGYGHAQPDLQRQDRYTQFNQMIETTTPGGNGLLFLPLSGGRHQSDSEPRGGFIGLSLQHSHADMGRAILESAAYELNWALEQLGDSGMSIDEMWMIGGAARSPVWPQIIADAAGVEVLLTQYSHGPALGAAMLAGVGVGIFNSTAESREIFTITTAQVHPDQRHYDAYQSSYQAYKAASNHLKQL